MRWAGLLVLILGAMPGAASAAEPIDGTWSGTLSCAQLSITEDGTGTVGADGTVQLSAVWRSQADGGRIACTVTYAGRLTGNVGTLSGTQVFTVDGKAENRSCGITLSR